MRLLLNEQEITDGICVFVANKWNKEPEEVEVEGIDYNGTFTAKANVAYYYYEYLSEKDIYEGIVQFLSEYHSFNPELMTVELQFDKEQGFSAEVAVNE